MSSIPLLSADALRQALNLRDLTDPDRGPHALQLLVSQATEALSRAWGSELRLRRELPIVSVEDNYDALSYPKHAIARDARYTRYVSERVVLRTHTTAMLPGALRELSAEPARDVLLACPGIVYRRDCIDRLHTGEPHQLDLWRIRTDAPLGSVDLREMIERLVEVLLPGARLRVNPAVHPYTVQGLEIEVELGQGYVEIGECGLAHPELIARSGLPVDRYTGLAMGLGLDRILMLRKRMDDIRLLRAEDSRISAQLLDLEPYRAVSRQPSIRRDLSIVVDEAVSAEALGDRVRAALGNEAKDVESVELVSETPYHELPAHAVARLGIRHGQKNALVRLVIRNLERPLTHAQANLIRNRVYRAIHEGENAEWATSAEPVSRS